MFICENCIEKCEGPAVEIAKHNGTLSRGACEDCRNVGNCYDLPSRANWKYKSKDAPRAPRKVKKPPTPIHIRLTQDQLVTLHFAVRNYQHMLESEIKNPTRDHGPAESAMALVDLKELVAIIPEPHKR